MSKRRLEDMCDNLGEWYSSKKICVSVEELCAAFEVCALAAEADDVSQDEAAAGAASVHAAKCAEAVDELCAAFEVCAVAAKRAEGAF